MTRTHVPLSAFRNSWFTVALVTILAFLLIFFATLLYVRARQLMEGELRSRLLSTATAASMQFDGAELTAIRKPADMRRPEFKRIAERLKTLMTEVPNIKYAYIMRRTDDPNTLSFVADGDILTPLERQDKNANATIDPSEDKSYPGDPYDISLFPAMSDAFNHPSVDPDFTTDQWGTFISGYAPVRRFDTGEVVAIIGLDMTARDYATVAESILSPVTFVLLLVATAALGGYFVFFVLKSRIDVWQKLEEERAGLMLLTYHQLGSPLTIFKWSLESLRDRDPGLSLEDAVQSHVTDMDQGITRMDRMIRILKEAAELQEGQIRASFEPHDLRTIVDREVASFADEAREQKKTLGVDMPDHMLVSTDATMLSAVLRHLLSNAMDYTPAGATVTVSAEETWNKLKIDVTDTGYGIPPDDLPRMFNKFTRAKNAPVYQPDGNGLGLFIVKGFVEKLGGEITVKSKLGKGTTFTITFPLRKSRLA